MANRPSVLYRATLYVVDTDSRGKAIIWGARFGDLQVKGDSPAEAMEEFDKRWFAKGWE